MHANIYSKKPLPTIGEPPPNSQNACEESLESFKKDI
jgi:hypothetical protein